MVTKFLLPQEIEVFYIIPSLKSQLSWAMKDMGMKQSRIAELLQVDKATISQYISKKRGSKVKFDEGTILEVRKSAELIHDKVSMTHQIQRLLVVIRRSKMLCRIHREVTGDMHCSRELEAMCINKY